MKDTLKKEENPNLDWMQELVMDVTQGNPCAMTVVRELQWFSRWEKMLRYFKEIGLTGGALWAKCSDEYHLSFHDFGHAIDKEMSDYYAKKNPRIKFNSNSPKFN